MIFWAGKFTCHLRYMPYSQFYQVTGTSEDARYFTRNFNTLQEPWTDETVMQHIMENYGRTP